MRRKSSAVSVGGVQIGAGAPVTVQSMLTVPLTDTDGALAQCRDLVREGCDIIRAAVPDEAAAAGLGRLAGPAGVPLVADIHFDHRLAILAAEAGAAKIRINPGNIGGQERVRAVASCLSERGIPVRIGVNAGSLPKDLLNRYGGPSAEAMVESAASHIAMLEECGFFDIVVSLKASDVVRTVQANRLFAARFDYPLHLGVTEAGLGESALIASAAGIGSLLLDGIGDTIRVSMTGDPVPEAGAGREILRACGLWSGGVRVVSCPTCARTRVDLASIAAAVKEAVKGNPARLTVAVMGCAVNGPGEAREADVGVACGQGVGLIFAKGEKLRTVPESMIVRTLLEELDRLAEVT